jgi:hypothetical protein
LTAWRDAGSHRWPIAATVAMTVVYIAGGTIVAAGYDSGRDLAQGLAIARGIARPDSGPSIAGAAALGPWYYYLVAAPLALFGSWLSVALWIATLGALQLPLGHALGHALGGPRLGLAVAAASMLPGWGSFELVGFAHTNLVRVAVMAWALASLLAWRRRSPAWFVAAALAATVAVHAHPTTFWTLLALPVLAARLAWTGRERAASAVAVLAALLVAALAFWPLIAPGSRLIANSAATASANVSLANLARSGSVLVGLVLHGPTALWQIAWGDAPALARAGGAACIVLVAAGGLGAIAGLLRAESRCAFAGMLAWFAIALTATVLVRPTTPFYMTYAVLPAYALVVGAGWHRLAVTLVRDGASLRPALSGPALSGPALAGLVLAAIALWLVALAGLARTMTGGLGRIPAETLVDVARAPAREAGEPDVWMPAWGVDALGKAVCAGPIDPYGALRYVLDVHYYVPVRLHCREPAAAGTGRRVAALPRAAWPALGFAPEALIGSLGLVPVGRLIAPGARDVPALLAYPPHPVATGPALSVERAFDAPAGALVVASNPAHWWAAWSADARCDGQPAQAIASDRVARVYRCASAAASPRWVVTVRSPDPGRVEIFTLDAPAAAPAPSVPGGT